MNSQIIQTPDGISWYVESVQNAAAAESPVDVVKEHIVLIPSGEGDCHNLAAAAMALASTSQVATVVTTFDMPGFSRSTAPREAYEIITPEHVSKQIITLLDNLHIRQATFFGCSSGGGAVLALAALYPEHVKCGVVHEVPFASPPHILAMREGTDEELAARCRELFSAFIEDENDGKRKWSELGDEYHHRLEKNFATWLRHLVTNFEGRTMVLATEKNLLKRPLFWTVGGLSPRVRWGTNFEIAKSVGLKVETDVLMSNHFPAVTVPEDTAKWILHCIGTVNSSNTAL